MNLNAPDFEILMDFPGWTRYHEIVNICRYVHDNNISDILDVGAFGGRLTSALCRSFPDVHVTAIDTFGYVYSYGEMRQFWSMTCGDRFLNEHQSIEQFRSMHSYTNLTSHEADFFLYDKKHQLILIELHPDNENYTWEMVFDHSLNLSTGINGKPEVIGVCSELGPKNGVGGIVTLHNLYNYDILYNTPNDYFSIYKIINKKEQ